MVIPKTRKGIWIGVLIGVIGVVGAVSFLVIGSTPTTTGYAENDTVQTVTLDNCSDSSVTVTAGTREQIAPFQETRIGDARFSAERVTSARLSAASTCRHRAGRRLLDPSLV